MGKDVPEGLQSIPSALRAACRICRLCCAVQWEQHPGIGVQILGQGQMESSRVKSKILELPMGSSLVSHGHPLQSYLQKLLPAFQEPWKTRILQEGSEGWRDPTAAALGFFVGSPCDHDKAELRNSESIP